MALIESDQKINPNRAFLPGDLCGALGYCRAWGTPPNPSIRGTIAIGEIIIFIADQSPSNHSLFLTRYGLCQVDSGWIVKL